MIVAILSLAVAAGVPGDAAPIRLGQLGFESRGLKRAILVSDAAKPLSWRLVDSDGRTIASGLTLSTGFDAASGERLHRLEIAGALPRGSGYRLIAGSAQSRPFDVAPQPFGRLARDAMSFFYQQRAGVPIEARYLQRADLARPAGHTMEIPTCFSGRDQDGAVWPGCGYRLNVTGGWYDAGDHGKYVVNAGVTVWTLLNLHETQSRAGQVAFRDGALLLPERGNGVDDLLDEVRFELEFLLRMQLADGTRIKVAEGEGTQRRFVNVDGGGLVHHKVADHRWTPLPTAPAEDPRTRYLYPPSTAATLNLAAVAAQAARAWRGVDPAFAVRCLDAARRAFAAAERHPAMFASSRFDGSGGYDDQDVSDEFFWAAAELFATTGEATYGDRLRASHWLAAKKRSEINWRQLETAGLITLATVQNRLAPDEQAKLRASVLAMADAWLADRDREGYAIPYSSTNYPWGSNSTVLNRALLLGVAHELSGRSSYRDGMTDAIDYVLGRNPLDRSYVSGYGARPMRNPHHRFWAHSLDKRYPAPPPGVLSGGPNNGAMSDPVARGMKGRCVAQTCWVDDIQAFSQNEVAINWNAPLVWVATRLDRTAR